MWEELHRLDREMKVPYSASGTVIGIFSFLVAACVLWGVGAVAIWGSTPFSTRDLFPLGVSLTFLAFAWDYIWIWYMRHRYAARLSYW